MNVNAQAGQQIIPKFTITADIVIEGNITRLPPIVVDASSLKHAAIMIAERAADLKRSCLSSELRVVSISNGALSRPDPEANISIVGSLLADRLMAWLARAR